MLLRVKEADELLDYHPPFVWWVGGTGEMQIAKKWAKPHVACGRNDDDTGFPVGQPLVSNGMYHEPERTFDRWMLAGYLW